MRAVTGVKLIFGQDLDQPVRNLFVISFYNLFLILQAIPNHIFIAPS